MSCVNTHHLLDLYFHEGAEDRMAEVNEHASRCAECRMYLGSVKHSMRLLSALGEEAPPPRVLANILEDVAVVPARPPLAKTGVEVVPILQIAFGEIFVFALIYFIKIQISFTSLWETIGQYPVVGSIGTFGVSVVLVLLAGSFITLALAPVLLMDADRKFSSQSS